MTDNELLLALSGMLDKKLKAELQPIKNELQTMKEIGRASCRERVSSPV